MVQFARADSHLPVGHVKILPRGRDSSMGGGGANHTGALPEALSPSLLGEHVTGTEVVEAAV